MKKKICILSDCFVPTKNSASGMMYNLANLFKYEYDVICVHGGLNPSKNKVLFKSYNIKNLNFITSNLFHSFRTNNLILRFFFEISLSLSLAIKIIYNFKKFKNVDFIIWYGPSSYLWFPAIFLKTISKSKLYYILRDIFPDWLEQVGLIKNKLILKFLNFTSYPQYIIPDIIGVENPESKKHIATFVNEKKIIIETLFNWPSLDSNIQKKSRLSFELKKKIQTIKSRNFCINGVYLGNVGKAQDFEKLLNILKISKLKNYLTLDIYTSKNLENFYLKTKNKNLFINDCNSVSDFNVPFLIELYDFGIVSLNSELKSDNLPGKLVSYLQFGLPVLCFARTDSALFKLIKKNKCGIAIDLNSLNENSNNELNNFLIDLRKKTNFYSKNAINTYEQYFSLNRIKQHFSKHF